MHVWRSLAEFVTPPRGLVLSIGNFDGVHRGHQRLLEEAGARGRRLGAPVAAMTFDPHPLAIVAPERTPPALTTLDEKLALLQRAGAEHVLVLHSEQHLLRETAEEFLQQVVARCRPRALVEGPDFHFGRGRSGNVDTLAQFAGRWSYELHVVPEVHCDELPARPAISSSAVRDALRKGGRVHEARALLGRPYRIVGVVGHGEARGRQLGFPTTNLEQIPHLLPEPAVYAAVAQTQAGTLHLAAVNVGPQPTFGQQQVRVEAHLLGFDGELHGERLGLHFLTRLRSQVRFADAGELVAQLRRDVAATEALAQRVGDVWGIPL